ncbi:serine/threonine protein kinase [Rubinisphaera italica]|uniref:non-specific serine/threonine protein kinase n=1 Tax=Rubinisphaera italica TaxID=2527969 RepID=A0A5C5XHJ3_9PLAN|nr:serine/threonine-protein kinase [Rubinisphaera italica]TWT62158.1 Serine/threonine-protein kinase PknB [Rubinisphaera italica]
MDFSSSKGLAKELVVMRLITKDQANASLRKLGGKNKTGSDLLDVMLETSVLTPFQVESIKRLDTDVLILGGCKLLYPNAAGSFARVFRAEEIETGKVVAVKLLRHRWVNDPETVDLFRREAELGMKLKHPNIVPIHSVGSENGYHFFIMDFVQGGNLKDFVQIRKQIEPAETVKYAIDMARGLEYALKLGFTHRDLKMTNVVFSVDGSAKLIDFGLATDDELLEKVGDGGVQHALEYSTLEKKTGAPRNDPRSDLFFLGTILYEMLLGEPPYPRTRSREERKQITRYRNIRALSDAMPGCPRQVSFIIDRLLHINPDERYQSPTELLTDLMEAKAKLDMTAAAQQKDEESGELELPEEVILMCIERRPREQDVLRDYFNRHGFRVLVISDVERAVRRINTDPPHIVLCMTTLRNGENLQDVYEDLIAAVSIKRIPTLMMVADVDADHKIPAGRETIIHLRPQPMALRDMRKELTIVGQQAGIIPKEVPK